MADQSAQGSGGGSGLQPNVASMLCYLCGWVTGLIFLLIEKDNKEVKFHAWNSIAIDVAIFAIYIALAIVATIITMISFSLGHIVWFLTSLLWLGLLAVKIVMMVKAYQGQRLKLPVIGDFAEKQAAK